MALIDRIAIALCLCLAIKTGAQTSRDKLEKDSLDQARLKQKKIYSSPRKASIMSAVFPGLGQIYNRKYWKAPVIYAGLGGLGYIFLNNNGLYNDYREALKYSLDNGGVALIDGVSYTTTQLQDQKISFRKNRDFAGLGLILLYLLNIIDANVDAHLKTFDVSDDLSLIISPLNIESCAMGPGRLGGGITLTLKLK